MLRIIHPHILIRDKLRDRPHYSWKEAGRRASWSDLRHTGRKIGDIVCPDQDHREAFPLITPQLSAAPPPDNVFVQTLIIDFFSFWIVKPGKTWCQLRIVIWTSMILPNRSYWGIRFAVIGTELMEIMMFLAFPDKLSRLPNLYKIADLSGQMGNF